MFPLILGEVLQPQEMTDHSRMPETFAELTEALPTGLIGLHAGVLDLDLDRMVSSPQDDQETAPLNERTATLDSRRR